MLSLALFILPMSPTFAVEDNIPVTETDQTQELVSILSAQEQAFYMEQQLEISQNDPIAYLYYKGKQQGLSDGDIITLQGIMYCESHYNRYAVNAASNASGLFQFLPSSWRVWGGGGDPFSIPDNISAAINYYKAAGRSPWVCPPVAVMPYVPTPHDSSIGAFVVTKSKMFWDDVSTPAILAQE